MAYDFKKECKKLYLPPEKPQIIEVPKAKFIAVSGKGDPNIEGGEYKTAVGKLYTVAYTIKMSKFGDNDIEGYFDFVVPPLEGFWKLGAENSFTDKSEFSWTSVIRMPDFVTIDVLKQAIETAVKKKKIDCSAVKLITVEEGLCVQCMHIGSYDDEPTTLAAMDNFIESNGYVKDLSDVRLHHEIYLSDPNKTPVEKLKTVLRLPIIKV